MFGIDSPELLVIAIVALVVIGPKELPNLLRSWGKWMTKMRGMASEFRGHVDEMVRQSDLDAVKKQLDAVPGLDLQSLDPTKQIKSMIQEGVTEGEKALADARSAIDNPLVEPESAPQSVPNLQPVWPIRHPIGRPRPPLQCPKCPLRPRLLRLSRLKRSRPRPWSRARAPISALN